MAGGDSPVGIRHAVSHSDGPIDLPGPAEKLCTEVRTLGEEFVLVDLCGNAGFRENQFESDVIGRLVNDSGHRPGPDIAEVEVGHTENHLQVRVDFEGSNAGSGNSQSFFKICRRTEVGVGSTPRGDVHPESIVVAVHPGGFEFRVVDARRQIGPARSTQEVGGNRRPQDDSLQLGKADADAASRGRDAQVIVAAGEPRDFVSPVFDSQPASLIGMLKMRVFRNTTVSEPSAVLLKNVVEVQLAVTVSELGQRRIDLRNGSVERTPVEVSLSNPIVAR